MLLSRRLPVAAGLLVALAAAPSPARAAFTGNNGQIAFSRAGDIYLVARDGTAASPLTSGAATDTDPAWSPDGTRIAFTRDNDIYAMNADGSGVTQLTTDPAADVQPSWSPDGTQIAFVSSRLNGGRDVWAMNADGTNQRDLTNTPVQSTPPVTKTLPDGTVTDVFPGILYGYEYSPAWSPDGTKIAFTSDRTQKSIVYTMNADGTAPAAVAGAGTSNPSWSPDGTMIAYQTNTVLGDGIAVGRTTGAVVRSFVDPFASDADPAFSPDGKTIVFRGLFRPTGSGLYRMPVAASGLLKLTSNAADQAPDWQPCATCAPDVTFVPPPPPSAPANQSSGGGSGSTKPGAAKGAGAVAVLGTLGLLPSGTSVHASSKRGVTLTARVLKVRTANLVRLRNIDPRRDFEVHIIGIDVPTAGECGGTQALRSLRKLLVSSGGLGRIVRVTTDPKVATTDAQVRVNGYVTVSGKHVELTQIGAGWAKAKSGTYSQSRRFRIAQAKAKRAKKGIWKTCGGRFHAAKR